MSSERRRGWEFPDSVRRRVLRRSRGRCEHPEGCSNRNNGTVDHFTGTLLAQYMDMDRQTIRSIENAQTLCEWHDRLKLWEENLWQEFWEERLGDN